VFVGGKEVVGRERDSDKDGFYTFPYSLHMSISSVILYKKEEKIMMASN